MKGKTLNIYLLSNFWSIFLLIISMFVLLVITADVVEKLDDFLTFDLPVQDYFRYYLFSAPNIFTICLPISVLLGVLYLFRMMSVSNAYVALITGGIPLRRILAPIIISAVFLCSCSFYLSNKIVPQYLFKRKVFQKEKLKMHQPVLKDVNVVGDGGWKYYFREYHKKSKKVVGLMITETDLDGKVIHRTFAQEVLWKGRYWDGKKVIFQHYLENGLPGRRDEVDEFMLGKLVPPEEILQARDDSKYLNSKELKELADSLPRSQNQRIQGLLVDYYRKFSFSFLPVILVIIAVPFGISPVKESSSRPIGIGVVLSLAYYLLDALFMRMGKGMILSPIVSAWTPNIVFLSLGLVLIRRAPQ